MAKIDDSVKKKVPELRFKGFTDDWGERKLGDAVSISSGVTGDATLQDGKYRLTRIESISQGMLNVARLGFTNEKPDQKYLLNLGDILYSNINSLSHIGKVALVDTTGIYHGINLLRFQMRNGVDSEFLFQRLNTMPMKNWAVSHANPAVSQASINQTELSKQPISLPTLTEQQQIGNFFKEIDNIIDLHQRKLDLLKEQKKGYLQKMFPKNGAKVPELRFAGFVDAWEERKFSDFTKLSQGLQIAISDRFTEAGPNKEFYITNEFLNHNNTKKYYIENPSKNVIANTNDILMTRTGNTGKVVTNTKGAFHNNFFKIDYDPKKISKLFLYFLLTSIPIQKEILIRAGTSTIPDLNHKDFYKIKVYLPVFEEQQKIGSFFKQLDETIDLHQRKLDLLKEQKKGFLQKMFV
ncbi:restriction endonuclease subunit S [Lactococcus hircilactis]|uniref:Restriction endonuclease subunit S n=1 Tax=Lactococcus hircilactis TaxID=1494462 RepID=A0A7X1ZA15_9LACT|nr:restriction endonuclease subunit S [Lactococcus hircilactis]MQW40603.1 restriction endonuclease subunit S [Lactococcus hircilactis]